jgi:hypothetical protein
MAFQARFGTREQDLSNWGAKIPWGPVRLPVKAEKSLC